MKYKGLIFDLDGTLVNSIHALVYCTNLALARFGLGPLNEEQMMTIVGDGYKMQMRRSLLACGDEELLHYEEILPEHYEKSYGNPAYAVEDMKGLQNFCNTRGNRGSS